ncbi:MAG: hypothetical protein IKA31_00320, partial [Clostridia bacterium]|nr:hypothetical protein [Clostridia bacterium]
TLTINGGIISNNIVSSEIRNAGAIYSTGNVVINSGLIYNNKAYNAGGAIYMANGTLDIYGGDIYDNGFDAGSLDSKGGAIYIASNARLNIYGGNIINNSAKDGGAIYTLGEVHVEKSLIYSNTATEKGGDIYSTANLTFVDGEIVENTAKDGGAIYITNGTLQITKLITIYNNSATNNGGAINSYGATINLYGGEIYANTANGDGGAIYLASSSKISVNSGEIYNNFATNGGAIYAQTTGTVSKNIEGLIEADAIATDLVNRITSSNFTVSGGYIYDNKTKETGNGGAIYLEDTSSIIATLLLNGGEITNNVAGKEGGAVYVKGAGFVEVNNNFVISENKAKNSHGGAIYLAGGRLLVNGGEITNNKAMYEASAIAASTVDNIGAELVVLAGKIINNINDNQFSAAVHIETGSTLFVGESAYIYDNVGGNVFLEDTIISVLPTIDDSAFIGVDNSSTTTVVIAVPINDTPNNYEFESEEILKKFTSDNENKKVFYQSGDKTDLDKKDDKVYLGYNEQKTLQYIASDYIGDYDGAYHTIGFEKLNNPSNVIVEFCSVTTLEDTNRVWKSEPEQFKDGVFRYIYIRITDQIQNESVLDYRIVNIRNIVPTISEYPTVTGKPSVNTVYSSTGGSGNKDNRPTLVGGQATYNGKIIEGSFIWSYDEMIFTNVGLQTGYVTFVPNNSAFSSVDFQIKVRVYANVIYYATTDDGTTGFFLDENLTQPSDARVMSEAINSITSGAQTKATIYMGATYVVNTTEYLYVEESVTIMRLRGFTGALFNVTGTAELVIGKNSSGSLLPNGPSITIDGGAVWQTAGNPGSSTTPNANNFAQNAGLVSEKSLIVVYETAKLSLYKNVSLINNDVNKEGESGGAIYCQGTLYIEGSSVQRNMACHGGAISLVVNAKAIINGATIRYNATYKAGHFTGFGGGNGGAIYMNNQGINNSEVQLLIKEAAISNNKSTNNGGAIYNNGGKLELAPVSENITDGDDVTYRISITRNVTANDGGAIYIANEHKSSLTITGAQITGNEGTNGDAIWYAAYKNESDEYEKGLIFDDSAIETDIYITGQIFLNDNSIIVQSVALNSDSEIEITTADSYKISRVIVEQVDFRDSIINDYTIKSNSDGYYLTEITTHGGNPTLQIGKTFTLFISYEYESSTVYQVKVNYGDTYEDYINGNVLHNVLLNPEVLATNPEDAAYGNKTVENIGFEIKGYHFLSEGGISGAAKIENFTTQIYYNQNLENNLYNLYISWSVSNPIIQLIPQSVQETYGNPILVEAKVINKNETDGFIYTYQWYKEDTMIDGATTKTLTIYNVDETGYYKVYIVVTGTADGIPQIRTSYSEKILLTILPKEIDINLTVNEFT